MFEKGGIGEGLAQGDADAHVGHGCSEFIGTNVAAIAGDVAVVGEGVDDGAGTAEVGGSRWAVVAWFEGRYGFGGHCWFLFE